MLRLHWAVRGRVSKRWQWNMLAARPAVFRYHVPCRVTITRHARKLLDPDNLYGAAKVIVDALKIAGLIRDDAPSVLDLVCLQEKITTKARTTITIEAIDALKASL